MDRLFYRIMSCKKKLEEKSDDVFANSIMAINELGYNSERLCMATEV